MTKLTQSVGNSMVEAQSTSKGLGGLRLAILRRVTLVLFFAVAAGGGAAALNSCATLSSLSGLSRMQFKLGDAGRFNLAGIDLSSKRSASDISVMDGVNLLNAFRTGKFPLTFTLNVDAKNPNQPTGNSALNSMQLSALPWRLFIDGTETISGGIGSPVGIPAGGSTQVIPLQVSVDLKQFFGNRGYNDLLNLAFALAGQGSAKLQLKAQPTVATSLGSFKYPSELTIVSTEFSN